MGRPQEIVNTQIGEYDIFIGILWKRFGTPTGKAESGTEEEFQIAYERWLKTEAPRIMFYFKEEPYVIRSKPEVEQVSRVIAFKESLQKQGLIGNFASLQEFESKLRQHLVTVLYSFSEETRHVKEATLFSATIALTEKPRSKSEFFQRLRPLLANFVGEKVDAIHLLSKGHMLLR
jgi:hypothetical protein